MNTQSLTGSQQSPTFFHSRNRHNRLMLYVAIASMITLFTIFKYLYPHANFIHNDSFIWINAASKNQTIGLFPIGYSKFLRLVNVFAKPDLALVIMQYLCIQSSVLLLLYTIFYFSKPHKITQWILLAFMVINPLFLHLSNLVSSDGIFLALSSTWFALLLWIIHKPSMQIIFWHALVLLAAFTVSYYALIYPIISALAFRLSTLSARRKVLGLGLGLLLCGLFAILTISQYKRLTGQWQYSAFHGWQLANNALFAYRMVDSSDRKPVAHIYHSLDNIVRKYLYETRFVTYIPYRKQWNDTYYMWAPKLPLMQYRDSLFNMSKDNEFKKWASMGPLYKQYGLYIIWKYPRQFATHVLWPNVQKYFAPPVEVLDAYNAGKKKITIETQAWFGYKKSRINSRMYEPDIFVLNFYPVFSAIMNVIMLFGLLYYIMLKGWQHNSTFKKTLIIGSSLLLLSASFIVCIGPVALRLQSFPLLLTTTFSLLLVDWMVQLMRKIRLEQNTQIKMKPNFSGEIIV